jgi:hypothetical protein
MERDYSWWQISLAHGFLLVLQRLALTVSFIGTCDKALSQNRHADLDVKLIFFRQ